MIVIPLIALLMIAVVRRVRKMQALAETAIGKFISNIDEMKIGMRTTKMAGQEEAEGKRISNAAQSIRSYTYKLMRTHALTYSNRSVICICIYVSGRRRWIYGPIKSV